MAIYKMCQLLFLKYHCGTLNPATCLVLATAGLLDCSTVTGGIMPWPKVWIVLVQHTNCAEGGERMPPFFATAIRFWPQLLDKARPCHYSQLVLDASTPLHLRHCHCAPRRWSFPHGGDSTTGQHPFPQAKRRRLLEGRFPKTRLSGCRRKELKSWPKQCEKILVNLTSDRLAGKIAKGVGKILRCCMTQGITINIILFNILNRFLFKYNNVLSYYTFLVCISDFSIDCRNPQVK